MHEKDTRMEELNQVKSLLTLASIQSVISCAKWIGAYTVKVFFKDIQYKY